MSEKQKENWKEEMRKIVKEEIKPLLPSTPKVEPTKETSAEHQTIEEAVACPDCYPKVRDLVLPKVWEETKNLDYECTECGLGVKGEESEKEEWKCKECGNKYAKER